jgi:hypothetical protein
MGLEFMRNTYTAEYRRDDTIVTVFLSRRNSVESARAAVDRYSAYATKFGEETAKKKIGRLELNIFNMAGIYDVVFFQDRLVGGVSSVEDRDLAVRAAIELWKQLPRDK